MSAGSFPKPAMIARFSPRAGRITMPDVRCHLVWAAGELAFVGPMSRARRSRRIGESVVLASFDPLGARRLIGAPLHGLTDHEVPFADLAPRLAPRVVEWMAGDELAALPPLEGLAPLCSPDPRNDDRLAFALSGLRDGAAVRDVADRIGMSERQLERIFAREIGLGPKTYARILRLRRTIELAKAGHALAAAAMLGGYSDQPHLNRDTRDLTGVSPTVLLPDVGNVQDALFGRAVS